MIRPGTDLAFNYALIHTILKEKLHDAPYVRRWVKGLKELQAFNKFPIADASHGNPQMLAHAILNEDPYPIKALIVNRFEPLQSIPAAATTP